MFSKSYRGVFTAVLVVAIVAWANASASEIKVTTKTFKAAKGGTLVVEIKGIGADIATQVWEKSEIEMRIEGLPDEALEDLRTSETGNTVRIEYHGANGWKKSRGVRFEFSVPSEISLDLGTSGGDVEVKGAMTGTVTLGTSGGDIDVEGVKGDVAGATSGGDIEVGKIEGKVDLKTSGGDVSALDVIGDADLATSGGDIEAGNIKGELRASTAGGDIAIGSVEKSVTASTAGGDVTVEDVGGDVKASTAGGDVVIGKVSGSATLKTAGGDIRLLGATGAVEAKTAGGDIDCENVSGSLHAATAGGDINAELDPTGTLANILETQGGDITIALPAGANVTIDATIKIRRGWGGWGDKGDDWDITSDFPAASHNKDTKLVKGRYVLGNGGATIALETVNGYIHIRKQAGVK
jgi:DUF4097 and DUF4098 domain-containing protein YvlB